MYWDSLPPLSEDKVNDLKAIGYLEVFKMLKNKDSKDLENE